MRAIFAAAVLFAAVSANAASIDERVAPCLVCHGEKGQSENPEIPSLGAQQSNFVLTQLYMFREKMRDVAVMNAMAKGLTDDDLRNISDYMSKLPAPNPPGDASDPAQVARAQGLIAMHHCNSCHAPNLVGQDQIPRLAGQREDYLLKSLRGYKSGERRAYDPAMSSVVEPLKDEDFVVLASYIAKLK